jgi:hypothetical protein
MELELNQKGGEPKMIKFWFTKDGKFVATTCVDGVVRDRNRAGDKVPQLRSKYTHTRGGKINITDSDWQAKLQELQVGQYVLLRYDGKETYGIITTHHSMQLGRNHVIAVQSSTGFNGMSMNNSIKINGESWKKYGSNAWKLNDGQFEWIKPVSIKKADDILDSKPDPYEWNTGFSIDWNGRIKSNGNDIETNIKAAHFALILDFSKLKKSDFKKKREIGVEREVSRDGALALKSDKDIKSENIKRYLQDLAKRMEVDENLGNVDKLVYKLVGHKNSFYHVTRGFVDSSLLKVLDGYFSLMKSDNKEYYLESLNTSIRELYKRFMNTNEEVTRNVSEIVKRLDRERPNNYEKLIKILSMMGELGLVIKTNIDSFKIENIEDMEILYQRIQSIKDIINSRRYGLDSIRYVLDYLDRSTSGYSYRYLTDSSYLRDPDDVINGIEKVISIIKRM